MLLLCDTALWFWKHFKISLSFLIFCPQMIELRRENGRSPDIQYIFFTIFLVHERRNFFTEENKVVINTMGIFMRKKNQSKIKKKNKQKLTVKKNFNFYSLHNMPLVQKTKLQASHTRPLLSGYEVEQGNIKFQTAFTCKSRFGRKCFFKQWLSLTVKMLLTCCLEKLSFIFICQYFSHSSQSGNVKIHVKFGFLSMIFIASKY